MPLETSADDFWRIAGYILGTAKDYLRDLDELPTFPPEATGKEVFATFAEPLPREGEQEQAFADLLPLLQ